jgi:hypothetical protein
MQKFWIKPPWFWCLRVTFFIYFFHLLSSRLFMLYFVLFRCMTVNLSYFCSWPGQNIYLKKTFQIPLRIKWPSPPPFTFYNECCCLYDMNQVYGSRSLKYTKALIGIIYLRGLASFSMVNVVVFWYESWI